MNLGFPTLFLYFFYFLHYIEKVQFHGSIQKANENQEVTSHRSARTKRVTNNSSSSPFCVQTVTGMLGHTQLLHFINIC